VAGLNFFNDGKYFEKGKYSPNTRSLILWNLPSISPLPSVRKAELYLLTFSISPSLGYIGSN